MAIEQISQLVDNYTRQDIDRLTKLVRAVIAKLEAELNQRSIPARVAGRVKNPSSLYGKLSNWADKPEKSACFAPGSRITDHVRDLAAVRVMTYTERDRPKVADMIKDLFRSPMGISGFDLEEKEQSERIRNNPQNHYRATHMLVALKTDDLVEDFKNLGSDLCEIQVTSMLAHVWNEIEHDTVYKQKSGTLSDAENKAIDSLGLLTKTGDNIIESLLYSRQIRVDRDAADALMQNERFADASALASFLNNHFGEKIAGETMDFQTGSQELFDTLQRLDWHHPNEIRAHFSPSRMAAARKSARKLARYQGKLGQKRNTYRPKSCDLFTVALFQLRADDLATRLEGVHANNRVVALLDAFRACRAD
ncbi:GTP pyrophosphokinase family protein [Roseibium sp.]|uniref:GTP pyrophosphokinase n=1 Tax=Roseibium sp. TaxID=1936156 RepID=UPI003518EB53